MRIISGGQTGADQGALGAAIKLKIPHGGFCPMNRRCETGTIPPRFTLTSIPDRSYAARTARNVEAADATIIFTSKVSPGTVCTIRAAERRHKPYLCLNPAMLTADLAELIRAFLREHKVEVLNVAGHRESQHPGMHDIVQNTLIAALTDFTL